MRLAAAVGVALLAALAAGCGAGRRCPAPPSGQTDAYLPALRPSSGPAGSTVSVTTRLPLFDEAGKYLGPGTPDITAYWNLDLDHWTSILRSPKSPSASVAGVSVDDLGTHHVTSGCEFRMRIKVPSVPAGTYPLVFLYEDSGTTDANGPARFRVTAG